MCMFYVPKDNVIHSCQGHPTYVTLSFFQFVSKTVLTRKWPKGFQYFHLSRFLTWKMKLIFLTAHAELSNHGTILHTPSPTQQHWVPPHWELLASETSSPSPTLLIAWIAACNIENELEKTWIWCPEIF